MAAETFADLLAAGADDAPAILAPDRPTLTHGQLRAQCRARPERGVPGGRHFRICRRNEPTAGGLRP